MTNRTLLWELPLKKRLMAGQVRHHTNAALGASFSSYEVDVTRGANWPSSGDVLEMRVKRSTDGGKTWVPSFAMVWGDEPIQEPIRLTFAPHESFRITFRGVQTCEPKAELYGIG